MELGNRPLGLRLPLGHVIESRCLRFITYCSKMLEIKKVESIKDRLRKSKESKNHLESSKINKIFKFCSADQTQNTTNVLNSYLKSIPVYALVKETD